MGTLPRKCYFCKVKHVTLTSRACRCISLRSAIGRVRGNFQHISDMLAQSGGHRLGLRKFRTAEIFDFSRRLFHLFGDRASLVFRRMRSYAYSGRRGNLKLPAWVPRSFYSGLDKVQVRKMLYQVGPDESLHRWLDKASVEMVHRVLPGTVWTGINVNIESVTRRVDTPRLAERFWPRDTRQIWPSSPSFSEMMEMSRRGKTPSGFRNNCNMVKDHVTKADVRSNSELARYIVRNNIIAVRDTVPIPAGFSNWFRSRRGFLFLCVRRVLPMKLVRSLLAAWITNPFNLWLREKCRFKHYLKLLKRTDYVRGPGAYSRLSDGEESQDGLGIALLAPPVLETEEDSLLFSELMNFVNSRDPPAKN